MMVQLLKIPGTVRTVKDALGTANYLDLPNVVILSELPSNELVLIHSEMEQAHVNWLLDRIKALLITPSIFEKVSQ